jgi:hypothetical protein
MHRSSLKRRTTMRARSMKRTARFFTGNDAYGMEVRRASL